MADTYPDFEAHDLEDGSRSFVGHLPAGLDPACSDRHVRDTVSARVPGTSS